MERSEVGSSLVKLRKSFSPRRNGRGDTRIPVVWSTGWRKEKANGTDICKWLKEEAADSVSQGRSWKRLKRWRMRRGFGGFWWCLSSEEWTERQTGVFQSYGIKLGS